MISIVSLSTLYRKIRDILFQKNILSLEYFVVACCITFVPIGVSFAYYYHCDKHIALLENQLLRLRKRYKTLQDCENRRQRYENLYLSSNSAYLHTITNTITPLKDEIEYLQMIIPFYPPEHSASLRDRLHFLQRENRFQFHETTRSKDSFLDEITIQQVTPIELNMHDLQTVLFHLEGISDKNNQIRLLGRPQILISHLDMYKEKDSSCDTFMIKLELIQREIKQ